MIPEANRIPIEDFKRRGAAILRRIAEGERFYLTRHGRPVAVLAAPDDEEILANRDKLAETPLFVPKGRANHG